jgi:hypothetical protein
MKILFTQVYMAGSLTSAWICIDQLQVVSFTITPLVQDGS